MSTMQSTKAIVANEPTTPGSINWSLQEVQYLSSCGPDEVLVEIVATGLCHTDVLVSTVPEGFFGIQYPKVMGHEGAGYIRAIGPSSKTGTTSKLQINDPVLLSFPSCAACAQCTQGHPAYCTGVAAEKFTGKKIFSPTTTAAATSSDKPGQDPSIYGSFLGQSSFARYTVVNASSCFSVRGLIRQDSDLQLFAPLGCSFLTGVGAVQRIGRVNEDGKGHDSVLIMGLGGVGMGAFLATVQSLSQNQNRTIIVLDQHASRLQLAKDLGATHVLNTRDPDFNFLDAVRAICPEGPSVVVDTTGVPELIERGLEVAAVRGRIVLVGVPPVGYMVGAEGLGFVNSGKSVLGCLVGDSVLEQDIPQIIQWYYEGRFPLDRLITKVPAEDYETALRGVEKGEIIKPVLVWDESLV